MMTILLIGAALLMAFSNGANDNFKGFATVWGSETLGYKKALVLATIATLLGSLASIYLAQGLVLSFSGKGLVPDVVASAPRFMTAVALAAALTVFLATRLGLPVSTTHALIGGLIGAGISQAIPAVNWAPLSKAFVLPLLLSPLVAAIIGFLVRRIWKGRQADTGLKDCACIVATDDGVTNSGVMVSASHSVHLVVDTPESCANLATPVKVSTSKIADGLHTLSAATICFARGVNDTPKLAALLLAAHVAGGQVTVVIIAIVMAGGGWLLSRQVAETMSHRMTLLDHREGMVANFTTAVLVLFASHLGLPVSTTHVAVGAIAGVGAGARRLNMPALHQVVLSWVLTLPLAGIAAYLLAKLFSLWA